MGILAYSLCLVDGSVIVDASDRRQLKLLHHATMLPNAMTRRHLKIEIQTHKRFKRTLFIRTKHNMRIFGLIPFIELQNDTETRVKQ